MRINEKNELFSDSTDQLNDTDFITDTEIPGKDEFRDPEADRATDDYRDPRFDCPEDDYRDPEADYLPEGRRESKESPESNGEDGTEPGSGKSAKGRGYFFLCLGSAALALVFVLLLCLPKSPKPADAVYGFELPEGLLFGMENQEALSLLSLTGLVPQEEENGDLIYYPERSVKILGEEVSLHALRFTPSGHALTTASVSQDHLLAQDGWLDTLVFELDFKTSRKVFEELTDRNGEPASYTADTFPQDEAFSLSDRLFTELLGESGVSGNILIFNGTHSVYDITPASVKEAVLRYIYGIEDRYERKIPADGGISPYVGVSSGEFKAPSNRILSKACLFTRMDGTSYLIYQDVTAGYAHYFEKQYQKERLEKERNSLTTLDFSELFSGLTDQTAPSFGFPLPNGLSFGMTVKEAKKALSVKNRQIQNEEEDTAGHPGLRLYTVTLEENAVPAVSGGLTGYVESLTFIRYNPRMYRGYFPEDSYYLSGQYYLTEVVCRFSEPADLLAETLKNEYGKEATMTQAAEAGIHFISDADVYHLDYPLVRAALEQDMQRTAELMNQITMLDQTADDYLSYSPLAEFTVTGNEDGTSSVWFHSLLADRADYYYSVLY